MKHLYLALAVAGVSAGLCAQRPASTNTLAFPHGGEIQIAFNQLDVGGGQTLKNLMAEGDEGAQYRQRWNGTAMQKRINGQLKVATATKVGDNELEPGSYMVSFRIDDDRVWHLVVSSEGGDEICAAALDVKEDADHSSKHLMIVPLATDNSKGKGNLEIRFGQLAAALPFATSNAEGKSSEPGANTNQDAPTATHALASGEDKLTVSYKQLTLAGGKSIKNLMAEGEQGTKTRSFYNDRYLPDFLKGKLELSQALRLGEHTVPAGAHGFTFKIDDKLVWHFVVTDGGKQVCDIPLTAEKGKGSMSERLVVQPVASAAGEGHLAIRYGPLTTDVPFTAAPPSKPADGK